MALSIGVVEITYLDQPGQPMYRFMQDLMGDPNVGLNPASQDDEDGYWGDGWGSDSFFEFYREGLLNRARGWAGTENLDIADTTRLLDWVENLPYREDTGTITLHLSV